MTGFFQELKRRKVYRVAIAYIVLSWALAQGLAQVLPVFEISNSVIRIVIVLPLIGFPVALVLAWVFDITPAGIQRTSKVTPQGSAHSQRRRNANEALRLQPAFRKDISLSPILERFVRMSSCTPSAK